jgi:hypothetical protein
VTSWGGEKTAEDAEGAEGEERLENVAAPSSAPIVFGLTAVAGDPPDGVASGDATGGVRGKCAFAVRRSATY